MRRAGRLSRASFDQRVKNKQIAAPAIDVFDIEALPPSHPFRTLDNVLATPHIATYRMVFTKTFLRGYRLEDSQVARHPSELGRDREKQC